MTLITEDIILDHAPISKVGPIYGLDSKNGEINPIVRGSSHTQSEPFTKAQGEPPMFAK